MNTDVLVFREFPEQEQKQVFSLLIPVYAIECEARPPIDTELDAYEEVVLKLLSIGLLPASIRNSINTTPGVLETILSQLSLMGYVEKKKNMGWVITENGAKYLNDEAPEDRASKNSEYGYMFVSALRKDALCYFHAGPVDKIRTRRVEPRDLVINRNSNEADTFTNASIDSRQLGKAYVMWSKLSKQIERNKKTGNRKEAVEETRVYSEQMFAENEVFDEAFEVPLPEQNTPEESAAVEVEFVQDIPENKRFIRRLETPLKRYYIQVQLVFDPVKMNGYYVVSPFDSLNDVDSPWFLKQVQWMSNNEDITISGFPLGEYLDNECVKFGVDTSIKEKDVSVYIRQVIPGLRIHSNRFQTIYEIFPELYSKQQNAVSLLEKENVVTLYCTKLLEPLFNMFFKSYSDQVLRRIKNQVNRDDRAGDGNHVCQRIENATGFSFSVLSFNSVPVLTAITRIAKTHGNSTLEKAINLLALYTYAPTDMVKRYVEAEGLDDHLVKVSELNFVRRLVSHDTSREFSHRDYEQFMQHVFPVANRLISAIVGG